MLKKPSQSSGFLKLNLTYAVILIFLIYSALIFGYDLHLTKRFLVFIAGSAVVINFFKNFFLKIGSRLVLVVATAALTLAACDIVIRTAFKSFIYYRPFDMLGSAMPEYPMLGRLKKNTAYTGVAYGDLAAMSGELNFKEDRMVSYITDSRGFRNKPGQEKKQNKIIVLGDSFGSGGEIEQDSTFVSFLSREHEDAVYNLSYPGNPLDELANLVIEIDEINLVKNPVVLWCIFTGNDVPLYLPRNGDAILDFIAENRLKEEMKSSWISATKVKIRTFFNRSPLRQMVVRIRAPKNTNVQLRDLSDSRKVYFLKHYAEMASLSKEEIQNDVKFNTFKRVFEVAKKFAQEKGITLKVILIPTKSEVYDWLYNGMPPWTTNPHPSGFGMALEELLRKLQIDYYDSKPYLIEQAKKKFYEKNEILWWSDDTHFNANGQRAFSDFIETHVLSEN